MRAAFFLRGCLEGEGGTCLNCSLNTRLQSNISAPQNTQICLSENIQLTFYELQKTDLSNAFVQFCPPINLLQLHKLQSVFLDSVHFLHTLVPCSGKCGMWSDAPNVQTNVVHSTQWTWSWCDEVGCRISAKQCEQHLICNASSFRRKKVLHLLTQYLLAKTLNHTPPY